MRHNPGGENLFKECSSAHFKYIYIYMGGIQVDLKKIPLVSVNWHNFDQMLVHMFVFIYQHCCLIVIFM